MVLSKSVAPLDDTDILDLYAEAICKVGFGGVVYKARVINYGMYVVKISVLAYYDTMLSQVMAQVLIS